MINIIHLASGDLWAGAEVQLYNLAGPLNKNRAINLAVVLLNHGQLEQELRLIGIDVYVIDEAKNSGFSIIRQLYRIAKKFNVDIIHTHRIKENVIGGFVAKIVGARSVRTAHGASESKCALFDFRGLVFSGMDMISAYFLQQKIIAVSTELKDKLSAHYPASRIQVIQNSIDIDNVGSKANATPEHDIDSSCFNVAFIGRFVPVKRTDIFYEFSKLALKNIKDEKLKFYMLGDGPLWDRIAQKIGDDNISNKIVLTGFVENTAPILKNMDLLVFTSDHEGLPMTLLEAMALDVPVMSRDLATIKKVLCDGRCGYIVSDSVSDMVVMLQESLNNREGMRLIANEARRTVIDHYSIGNNIKEYVDTYSQMIGKQDG